MTYAGQRKLRLILIILVLFLMVITACTPQKADHFSSGDDSGNNNPPPPPPPPFATLINNAWGAYNDNDLTAAQDYLAQIEAGYPDYFVNPLYWNVAGWISASEQQLDSALSKFSKVIQYDTTFDSTLADAYAGRAAIQLIKNQFPESIASAETVLTIDPNYNPNHDLLTVEHIYLMLAEAYFYSGDLANSLIQVKILNPGFDIPDLQAPDAALTLLQEIQTQAQALQSP